MKQKLIVLLFLFTSACSFNVQVITPEPSTSVNGSNSQTAVSPADATATLAPATASASASPTDTPPSIPEFTASPSPRNLGTFPIRFNENGTYADVTDTILAGTSKTYSIRALQGQGMSVSIRQSAERDWTYIPIKVGGADGSNICPQADRECTFWRGALPKTQDYLVTVTPASDAIDFVLRVAVNPPGATTQGFEYTSKNQQATLSYSDEFAPVRFPGAEIYKIVPELALQFIDTDSYTDTNLTEAYFLFGASDRSDVVDTCLEPISQGGPEEVIRAVSINGIPFVRSKAGGVAAGNIYEQTYYRTAYQGVCYEITFFVHYGNIGAYAPDSGVKEFDAAGLNDKFEDILSTLIIK